MPPLVRQINPTNYHKCITDCASSTELQQSILSFSPQDFAKVLATIPKLLPERRKSDISIDRSIDRSRVFHNLSFLMKETAFIFIVSPPPENRVWTCEPFVYLDRQHASPIHRPNDALIHAQKHLCPETFAYHWCSTPRSETSPPPPSPRAATAPAPTAPPSRTPRSRRSTPSRPG